MSSYRVEVPQDNRREVGVGLGVVLKNHFDKSLGLAVRVSNIHTNLICLFSLGIVSINSRTRREYDIVTVELLHHLE